MKAKRKGTRNEHRTMQLLEAAGYSCTRAAGSLGLFDVVAIGSVDVVLVQVKTRDWPGSVEMEQLRSFPCPLTFNLTLWTLCATGRAVQPPPGTVRSTSEGTGIGAGRPTHVRRTKFSPRGVRCNGSSYGLCAEGQKFPERALFQRPSVRRRRVSK